MYEDNDNLYLVSDMDEDIKKRKELIEEAKNINADKNHKKQLLKNKF